MKALQSAAILLASLWISIAPAHAGSARAADVSSFYESADLVAVVRVNKVTKVVVPTGGNQTSDVYVAEAEVLQTLKSDLMPVKENRKIAIVGSTIPMSSAVWEPIKTQRYLAFLNSEQGHYTYGEKFAMRPISPEGKVEWLEKNEKGIWVTYPIDIEEAVKRIRSLRAPGK